MAEAILRDEWQRQGKDGFIVSSMGIHGLNEQEPSKLAKEVCEENGIDISSHRSRKLVIPELESSHLIFSMERIHRDFIRLFFPKFDDKSFLLRAWPEEETRKSNIRDPMGKPIKVYRQVYNIIREHVTRIIPVIEETYC